MSVPRTREPESGSDCHRTRLSDGRGRLAVWGLGYIGLSTATAFADVGVQVVGFDPAEQRVRSLTGINSRIAVSSEATDVLAADCCVHMIAVPTEREGEPFDGALSSVIADIAASLTKGDLRGTCPLVIIESTLTPGTTDELLLPILAEHGLKVGRDLLVGLAPRRDWFLAEGYSLRELDRVYGGVEARSAAATRAVLGLVNNILHQARTHHTCELVKCVENAFRHMDITLANELTLAYPDVDMVEVLRLAGTKWNIGTYHPSFGTGGYCIPLASRYLIRGAEHPEYLGLLRRTVETDDQMRLLVADAVRARPPVVILGVAYKGGIKVDILSPAKSIARSLRDRSVPVVVHDPLYDNAEIDGLLGPGLTTDDLPGALRSARSVLVIPDHSEFTGPEYVNNINYPREETLIVLDNHGVLADVAWADHVIYKRAGNKRWLDTEEDADI